MEQSADLESRKRVFKSVTEYLRLKPKEMFVPGNTWVRYAGRVFDNSEYLSLVDALLDGWITAGRYTEEFELALSTYLGMYSTTFINSGSSANLIAMSSLTSHLLENDRLLPGDEVVTVAAGFPTTVNPIVQNNLIPVFTDVEIGTYNINPDLIEDAMTKKTRAIFIAHTLGNPFDLDKIMKIKEENSLYLIEDNCDALGSTYNGKKTGTFGEISTISFYPAHHITTGEGGAVNTNDVKLERIIRSFRDWGRDCYCEPGASDTCGMRFTQKFGELPLGYDHKYVYSHIGYNMKSTDLQAAIGVTQMKKLDEFVRRRKDNFRYFYKGLRKYEKLLIPPKWDQRSSPSWFALPLTVAKDAPFTRNQIVNYLEEHKIMTRPIFAGNLTRHPAYLGVKKRIHGTLKNTDYIMNNSFFIGVFPGITKEMRGYVMDIMESFLEMYI